MTDLPAYVWEYEIEGMEERIFLQIYEPKPLEQDWVCERRLTGPITGFNKIKKIYGVDKAQALELTLQIIPAELSYISDKLGRRITRLGDPSASLM